MHRNFYNTTMLLCNYVQLSNYATMHMSATNDGYCHRVLLYIHCIHKLQWNLGTLMIIGTSDLIGAEC